MRNRTLLYIALGLLFAFAATALAVHYSHAPQRYRTLTYDYRIPFTYDGSVIFARPEAAAAGLRVGDKILSINGRSITDVTAYRQELDRAGSGAQMDLVVERSNGEERSQHEISIQPIRFEKAMGHYLQFGVGVLFVYVLPTLCILLGFWVVLVRPEDYLAWLLLLLLLGVSSIGLEGYGSGSVVNSFRSIFGSSWGLSMFLFGLYFPERFFLDKKFPWLKWIVIIPLGYQFAAITLGELGRVTGVPLARPLEPINALYANVAIPLNMLGIGLFFALLGWKSGTLQRPDARRRLRIMVAGTMISLTPAFLIVLYSFLFGRRGSFFDVAPWWLALTALLLMLLFPMTLAYVIVVHRAMDVTVVIRQGLQYALARNGVRVLQILLLATAVISTVWIARNYGSDSSVQIGLVVAGLALMPLIDLVAKNLRTWIDRKFFREAYNSEQILLELSEDVRTVVETKPLLEMVSARISESLHVPQVALLLKKGTSFQPAYTLGYEREPVVSFQDEDKTIERLKRNEALVIYSDDKDSWINTGSNEAERSSLNALNSQLLLPLGVKDKLSGVLSLSPKRSEEAYSPSDLRLLRSVASQTGLALENSRLTEAVAAEAAQKERLNRELEIAREVQQRLFPQELPAVEGLDYYGECRPALGVGGDYYDFFELEGGKFGMAIGDVSGKGIGASLMMASLQASLRGQTIHSRDDLAGLMVQVNRLVYDTSTTNRYATFFYAQYDPSTRRLIYVNAGHNPPFLLRRNGSEGLDIELLEDGGPVVGMLPPMLVKYSQKEIELRPGDVVVGFTDGISEAMNRCDEEWGEDRLLSELKGLNGRPSKEILRSIIEAADKFADGAEQHDDMTMIVARVLK